MRADDTMSTERELLYKVLFDMRADINDLKRMMSELMHNPQAPCGPVHDVKALLPTTAQSSASAYAPAAVYAESEDVTDEPPREMTKADMQREQIIRALRRNNGAPPRGRRRIVHVRTYALPQDQGAGHRRELNGHVLHASLIDFIYAATKIYHCRSG